MGLDLPAPEFWTITLREADVIMRAAVERQFRQKRMDDGRTYTLAQLIIYSVNNPNKMPKFEKAFPDGRPRKRQSPEEMLALMRQWVETAQVMGAGRNG